MTEYIAIHDINPQAPVHLLVITKKVIPTLNDLNMAEDAELVGGMFLVASQLMKQMGRSDYRTVFNCGPGASSRFSISIFTCWREDRLLGRRGESAVSDYFINNCNLNQMS